MEGIVCNQNKKSYGIKVTVRLRASFAIQKSYVYRRCNFGQAALLSVLFYRVTSRIMPLSSTLFRIALVVYISDAPKKRGVDYIIYGG